MQIPLLLLIVAAALVSCHDVDQSRTLARSRRMINGDRFAIDRTPVVLVRPKQHIYGLGRIESTCSGSLITPQHVLSAAHCFTRSYRGRIKKKNLTRVMFFLGLINGAMDLYKIRRNKAPAGVVAITIQEDHGISIHPGWFSTLAQKREFNRKLCDISVIKLPYAIDLKTSNLVPAVLFAPERTRHGKDHWYPNGVGGVAMGWGLLGNPTRHGYKQRPKKGLRRAGILTKNLNWCKHKARSLNYFRGTMDIDDIFCGRGIYDYSKMERPQVCFGDSGGPMFLTTDPKWIQLGITVWVDANCDKHFNGFLRVADHIDFIKEKVADGGSKFQVMISTDKKLLERMPTFADSGTEASEDEIFDDTVILDAKTMANNNEPFINPSEARYVEENKILPNAKLTKNEEQNLQITADNWAATEFEQHDVSSGPQEAINADIYNRPEPIYGDPSTDFLDDVAEEDTMDYSNEDDMAFFDMEHSEYGYEDEELNIDELRDRIYGGYIEDMKQMPVANTANGMYEPLTADEDIFISDGIEDDFENEDNWSH